MSTAEEYARAICRAAPLAVWAAKEVMISGADMSLAQALELELKLEDFLVGTEDFNEGMKAFAEKRKPVFKGEITPPKQHDICVIMEKSQRKERND